METIDQEKELRAKKSGRFIAYASVLLAVIYAIYLFVALDNSVVADILTSHHIDATKNAVGNFINSYRLTGIMYLIAYMCGLIAIWNQHTYLWWFLFAVYISQAFYTAVNAGVIIQSINHVKSGFMTLPLWITIIGSLALAIYMLIISIKRKSTFNR
ncbi:hypothetical protein [Staphylococcus debuckii]|uniref:DUF4386 domain-containing protein n=1 Tax=Staphylococcus debuckii TaxID=2044912 RepID=A0ABU9EYI7_9STAP